MSIALLSEEHGLKYNLDNSGAVLSGDRGTSTGLLEKLRRDAAGNLADKFVTAETFTETPNPGAGPYGSNTVQMGDIILDMIDQTPNDRIRRK